MRIESPRDRKNTCSHRRRTDISPRRSSNTRLPPQLSRSLLRMLTMMKVPSWRNTDQLGSLNSLVALRNNKDNQSSN